MYICKVEHSQHTFRNSIGVRVRDTCLTLCLKSLSARGLVACLPVRLLFKSTKHNAFYPV